MRTKFKELLVKSFKKWDVPLDDNKLSLLSRNIEGQFFEHFGSDQSHYAAKMKDLLFNLRDKSNKELTFKITEGLLTPKELVTYSNADYATSKLKDIREVNYKVSLADKTSNMHGGTEGVNSFTCFKCAKSNCKYYQMQTRGADEPMTTFVNCLECGNRWRC